MDYKTVLVTGGAGFVGSNFAAAFKQRFPKSRVIAFDNLRRRGSEWNIPRLKERGIDFVHGDIRNPEDLEGLRGIDLLLECSAEPSVLSGYGESPSYVINTNLMGTVNCLELARKSKADVVFLSTSRVYPYETINSLKTKETDARFEWLAKQKRDIPGWSKNGIDVDFSLAGARSLYGATKLCSELILQEYISMYGMRGIINRCGVIAGPWQFGKVDQGVFTLWMLAHYFKKPLSYIGFGATGKQVRDLLHVDDLFELIVRQLGQITTANGRIYNVGGGAAVNLSLRETTAWCRKITGNSVPLGREINTRPADVKIYIGDNQMVSRAFGWKPQHSAEMILRDIFTWIRGHESAARSLA